MKRIDSLVDKDDGVQLQKALVKLRPAIEEVNNSTVCEKEELDIPVRRKLPVKILTAAGLLIEDKIKNMGRKNG
jgi:hypothetical protein